MSISRIRVTGRGVHTLDCLKGASSGFRPDDPLGDASR
jgi:hypothetical protein